MQVDRHLLYLSNARPKYNLVEWQSLQTPSDFPAKRSKELATLALRVKFTVSGHDWCTLEYLSIIERCGGVDVLFSPFLPWWMKEIARPREELGVVQDAEVAREDAVESFWKSHLVRDEELDDKDDAAQ